jgi:hypothetical protein
MVNKVWLKIQQISSSKWFLWLFFAFLFAVYFSKSDRSFGWTNPKAKDMEVIHSDASGYYAWMPQWQIYHTKHFVFIDQINKTYPRSRFGDFLIGYSDETIRTGWAYNKYYSGTAILLMPFFEIGHLHANLSGERQDGYSWPYLLWVNLGTIFYCFLGLWGMLKLFDLFEIKRIWTFSIVLALLFGTNLSFYSNYFIAFSHVFGFALIAWILYFYLKWTKNRKETYLMGVIILVALSFIVRPTNVLILIMLPFFENSLKEWWGQLKRFLRPGNLKLWLSMLIAGLIVFVQMKGVHDQFGKWALNTYAEEGFNWSDPKFWDILFSFRKGLFVYAPSLILIIPTAFFLYKQGRALFVGWLVLMVALTYVLSSWWCWWYGGGLGSRPYIEFFPIIVLPVALALAHGGLLWRTSISLVFLGGIYLYQTYEFQIKEHILPMDGINKRIFQTVFLKKDLRYGWFYDLKFDSLPSNERLKPITKHWFRSDDFEFNGPEKMLYINRPFDNPLLTVISNQEGVGESKAAAKVKIQIRILSAGTTPSLKTDYFKNGTLVKENIFYFGSKILKVNEWCYVNLDLNPQLKWNEFDSLVCRIEEGNTFVAFKEIALTTYSIEK